ncbi:MAG: dCTP deaminase [Chloroflexota bacterium]
MILSDRSIRQEIESGRILIDPYDPELIQPASLDIRLSSSFLVFRNIKQPYIDVKQPAEDLMEMVEVAAGEAMYLHPREFVLGSTLETVGIPDDLVARLEGRSSIGRLGVVIHSTAGFIDPAFKGRVTLEISNLASLPIALYPGMRIGQLSFMRMTTPAERPYGPARGSKYNGQRLPTASRLYLDFKEKP